MQKIWSKPVISALWSAESNLQRHIEGSHRALYFQSRSQRNIVQQCTKGAGEREVARVTSLSLPYAGAWLTCAPIPALGLHMRGPEFVVAVKFRLGLNIYDKAGKCPSCGKESDELGDHGMVCGTGGESISRHNALRDAIFDTAASAGLDRFPASLEK